MVMGVSVTPLFLSGAFAGIAAMILLLSLLIGYAYSERMLWWHGATIGVALIAQMSDTMETVSLCALLRTLQVLLAVQTLRYMLGADGPVRGAWRAAGWLLVALFPVMALQAFWPHSHQWILAPWACVVTLYLVRAWAQGRPWIVWLAVGQMALGLQWLVWIDAAHEPQANASSLQAASLAALALAAMAIYLAMVWRSRLNSENSLRVQGRETVDPLTGFVMPRVFFTQVNDAQVRSLNLGYASVLLLMRLQNLEQIAKDREAETTEPVVLAAAQAIAGALRPQDIGARISGNRFGVLAEGVSGRQGAIELATRILAHGLRGGDVGLPGSELKFQIAAIEISRLGTDVSQILKGLEDALADMAVQPAGPPIRVLKHLEQSSLSSDGTLPT
jgi:GGDEF domain-containing protein